MLTSNRQEARIIGDHADHTALSHIRSHIRNQECRETFDLIGQVRCDLCGSLGRTTPPALCKVNEFATLGLPIMLPVNIKWFPPVKEILSRSFSAMAEDRRQSLREEVRGIWIGWESARSNNGKTQTGHLLCTILLIESRIGRMCNLKDSRWCGCGKP